MEINTHFDCERLRASKPEPFFSRAISKDWPYIFKEKAEKASKEQAEEKETKAKI